MENSKESNQETYYIIKVGRNFVTRYENRPTIPKLNFSLSNRIEDAQRFLVGLDSEDNNLRPTESEHNEIVRRNFLEVLNLTGGEIVKVTRDMTITVSYDLKEVVFQGDKIKFVSLTGEEN